MVVDRDQMQTIIDYCKVFRASHPFSAIMATSVIIIFMIKLAFPISDIIVTSLTILMIQAITGLINDYLDYENDLIYQKEKFLISSELKLELVRHVIIILLIAVLIISILYFTPIILLILLVGFLIAQTYNFGLKDTPLSIIVFIVSFVLMISIPFFLASNTSITDQTPSFFILGGIISINLHISNDLVDFQADLTRDANSFVQQLGKKYTLILVVLSSTGYILFSVIGDLQIPLILMIFIITITIIWQIHEEDRSKREKLYYLIVIVSVFILIQLPINHNISL